KSKSGKSPKTASPKAAAAKEAEVKPQMSEEASKTPMPRNIKPMLAKLKEQPFDDENWIYELKYDGYRAIAEVDKKEVNLYSRNLKSFNTKFKAIADTLKKLGHTAVLDGEVAALNDEGKLEFQLLQNYETTKKGDLYYYVFDLLYLNGYS